MSRRSLIWLLVALLTVVLAPLTAIGIIGGTTAGTRWLFETAEPYLPEALSIGNMDGTLFRDLQFFEIRYDDVVAIDTVRAKLEFWALPSRRVVISELRVDGVDVTLTSGSNEPASASGVPEFDLPFALELPAIRINDIFLRGEAFARAIESVSLAARYVDRRLGVTALSVRSDWLDLEGSAQLFVAQSLDVDANLRWRFQPPSYDELTGTLALDGARDAYRIEHQLTAPAIIATQGTLSLDPELSFDLDSHWDEWRLPAELDNGRGVVTRSGRLRIAGVLNDLDVDLITDVAVAEYPDTKIALTGNTDLTRARIDALEMTAEGAELRLDGQADWSSAPSADVRFRLRLDPALIADAAPSGQLEASGTVSGRLADSGPELAVVVAELSGVLNDQPVSGGAAVNLATDAVEIGETELLLGDNRLSLTGSAGTTMDLGVELELGELAQLDNRLSGRVEGRAQITGSRQAPVIQLDAEGNGLAVNESRVDRATLTVDFTDINNLETQLLMTGVNAASMSFNSLAFEQAGGAEKHQFRLDGTHPSGRFAIAGDGAYAEPAWTGTIEEANFETEALANWSLAEALDVFLSTDSAEVSPFCLTSDDGLGRVCGDLKSSPDADVTGSFEVRRFPLTAIPIVMPGDARLAGYLEAEFNLERSEDSLDATGAVDTVDARIETVLDGEPYTTTIDIGRLSVDVKDNRLEAGLDVQLDAGAARLSGDFEADDILSADAPVAGNLVFDVPNLAAIAFLFPDIANPTGYLDARAQVGGTRLSPNVESRAQIGDAAFGVLPAGIRITDLSLTMEQRDLERISINGRARSGEGQLAIQGLSRISDEGNWSADIELTGKDFELMRLPDWQVAASPDVRLNYADDLARIDGTLSIPRAAIAIKSVPETAAAASNDVVVHGENIDGAPDSRAYEIDLTTALGDEVSFTGFGLSTGIAGELRITGTDTTPMAGNGRLELRDGRYRAYGQNLFIERGDLTFNGPLDDPQLDVRAVRPIENAEIVAGIRITGPPSNLRSDVFSEPSMSDAEALSYVLTGRPLSGGQSTSDADLLNQAAFALGLSQAGSVAAQIRAGLGLDTLELDGGASAGRIVAGKRIGDRLLVEYGYGIVDKLGTLLLRYQLTSRIILESRTGSMSALDVLYSVKRQ